MKINKFALAMMVLCVTLFCITGNAAALMIAPAAVTLEGVAQEVKEKLGSMEGTQKSLRDDLTQMKAEVDSRLKEHGEKLPMQLKEAIDKALETYNKLPDEMKAVRGLVTDLEQRFASGNVQNPDEEKSYGQQFIEGDAYTALKAQGITIGDRRGIIQISAKTVTMANAGGLVNRNVRDPDIVSLRRQRLTVRDLLNSIQVNSNSVDYAKQTTRTNNAAPVAEGAAKPYSDYVWTTATVTIRTLAHLAKITRQAMDDAPRLMGEINSEMRYGLGLVEETQYLYGNNTGQNLNGIVPQADAFAYTGGGIAFPSKIDVIRLAMLQAVTSLYPADGIVLNDVDWADIELTKTEDGAYLFANPQNQASPRLWGLPIVVTPSMTAGDYLVGNFGLGATIYDRMGVEVLLSTENADDFEKNLATLRCEERTAIAVKRPSAFVTGTFADDITTITPAP